MDVAFARALHVLGVVLWIGGVAFVTTILLPAVQRTQDPADQVEFFERVEGRFASQSRITTLVVGASGFYLAYAWELWHRFLEPAYWWMHAMVLVWLIFSVMLFIAEPLFLHRWFLTRAAQKPKQTFRLIRLLHWLLLTISLVTVFGAVRGSHGG